MKYGNLIQICDYLQKFKKLNSISRVGDRLFLVKFGKSELFFDMDKSTSNIHTNSNFKKSKFYEAPFDIALEKRFKNSEILEIKVPKNNRVLAITTSRQNSYKTLKSVIYFEFTGRFTNVIITDENGVIIEALRHYENEKRVIKTGKKLALLDPIKIKEKNVLKITNFDEFFSKTFDELNSREISLIKATKIANIDKKINSLKESLNSLPKESELLKEARILNQNAQLITANLYRLNDYDKEFELANFSGEIVKFKLDESPKKSALSFFNESKKLKQKAEGLNIERENLLSKLNYNLGLKELVLNSFSKEEIEILLPKKSVKKDTQNYGDNTQNFYIGKFKISVGKNENGNISLLQNAKKNDFWFHLKDRPSAHVIVKTGKEKLSDEIIEFAAKLCVNMSVKEAGKYEVNYTKKENVKVVSGAFVNYTNYKTISVLKP
ncbi:MAG: NFACT RNA binding domain-containing protein [Campylobacter sp.]|nr:NFACT RNA binding domain-containing protein [Campylobacter sp.]